MGRCQDRNAVMFLARSAETFPNNSVTMSQDRNATTFHDRSVKMCQGKWKDKSAEMFPVNSARMYQDRSVKMCQDKSVEMCQSKCLGSSAIMFQDKSAKTFLVSNVAMFQDSNVAMSHHRNATTFQGNSAAMFPDNNASRFLSKSVMLLNHLMEEGSKKVKENEHYKSDTQILAENLNDQNELYSIRLLKKQTDEDLCPNNYLLMCSIYLNNLVKSYSIQQGN